MIIYSSPDPPAVHLMVDGETDVCSRSQDINFDLLGFTVYGQVTHILGHCHVARVAVIIVRAWVVVIVARVWVVVIITRFSLLGHGWLSLLLGCGWL